MTIILGTTGICLGTWMAHLCGIEISSATFVLNGLVLGVTSWRLGWL